ncbi:bifunctional folylpolyglutamate synthase/dihydrofolate synthase [Lentibacillus jeotgali]|uniref:bifunctional folylpolyglutamate synthase/dihydrofolate synthase n=1 Tax=Lentibacillus jeotgali TaxID=558169 RepID=UPI0002627005|nr:folylpolyglutamate synthase/dihydrofolate synthase family protein [Lentibacillus jeotgali]
MFEHFYEVEAFFQDRKRYGVKPGLGRIHKLLDLLNNPEKKMNAVHIAGTNGKGSTIHYLSHALMANGYTVGVFDSPSLKGLRGHILLNDSLIPEKAFIYYLNKLHPFVLQLDDEENHPTEFEIMTVMAFLYFADHTDIALVEAGMGGREDTTNCFIPILSIITNVSWDHTDFLGENIQSIAYHKAGIIKKNRPVIAGEMIGEALSVIEAEAKSKNAPLYLADESFQYKTTGMKGTEQTFQWCAESGISMEARLQVAGKHQVRNASLAIMTLVILERNGFELSRNNYLSGLTVARIPGRFEQIHQRPAIILDGAHNPAGVRAFTETLADRFINMERHLLFAAFKDKDLKQMLKTLEPHFSSVTLTTFDHPRAAGLEQLQQFSEARHVRYQSDWRQAIRLISFEQENAGYFITGSLHFIGMVRNFAADNMGWL